MAFLADEIFDNGLSYFTSNTENIHICSADPGSTWANIATYGLGAKSSPTIGSITDGTSGREVEFAICTDGSATATGDATHYAITDDSATKILASSTLSATLSVTNGGSFGLEAFTIGIPDPA